MTMKGQKCRQEVNEMTMLKWMLEAIEKDMTQNEHTGGTEKVATSAEKTAEKRLKGHGLAKKKEGYILRMQDAKIPGKRQRERQNT